MSKYYTPVEKDKRRKEVIREKFLRIRVTDEERARYVRIAKERGVTMSAVFRRAMEELGRNE